MDLTLTNRWVLKNDYLIRYAPISDKERRHSYERREKMPSNRRNEQPLSGQRHFESGLVAEPLETRDFAPTFFQVQPDGREFQLR
jgi:hypothetical protein